MTDREPIAWITRGGKHIPIFADEPTEDEKKKNREIAENKKQADEKNGKTISLDNISEFGQPGIYKAYRSGDIFDSPLGYLSFGLDRSQSYIYKEANKKPIDEFDIKIEKPYVITGNDFDKMQDVIAKKFAGESYLGKSNIKDMREVQRRAAKEMEKQGYDSILMDKKNNITGKHTYEINLLNVHKNKASRKESS